MGSSIRKRVLWFGCVAWALAPSLAWAAPVTDTTRAAARSLGADGVKAYQAAEYATATDKLERAYQLLKVPSLGLWSARALEKVGKLVEANERYLEVTRLAVSGGDEAIQKKAQQDAEHELEAVAARIPTVTIQIKGADPSAVTLTLDSEPVASVLIGQPQPLDPGIHHLVGSLGANRVTRDVTIASGENAVTVLTFAPPPVGLFASGPPKTGAEAGPTSPSNDSSGAHRSAQRTLGFVALGVGGAGLVLGGVTALLASGKRSEIKDSSACSDYHCLASESSLVDSYNSLRTVSSIGLISGAVVASAGVVLLLTSPSAESPRTALVLGPTSAALRGSF